MAQHHTVNEDGVPSFIPVIPAPSGQPHTPSGSAASGSSPPTTSMPSLEEMELFAAASQQYPSSQALDLLSTVPMDSAPPCPEPSSFLPDTGAGLHQDFWIDYLSNAPHQPPHEPPLQDRVDGPAPLPSWIDMTPAHSPIHAQPTSLPPARSPLHIHTAPLPPLPPGPFTPPGSAQSSYSSVSSRSAHHDDFGRRLSADSVASHQMMQTSKPVKPPPRKITDRRREQNREAQKAMRERRKRAAQEHNIMVAATIEENMHLRSQVQWLLQSNHELQNMLRAHGFPPQPKPAENEPPLRWERSEY